MKGTMEMPILLGDFKLLAHASKTLEVLGKPKAILRVLLISHLFLPNPAFILVKLTRALFLDTSMSSAVICVTGTGFAQEK